MRIAIPVDGDLVASHVGHCKEFLIADIRDGAVALQERLPNPGHGPGGPPPHFLARVGVQQVLAWGMPPHAGAIFGSLGVKVQLGVTGQPDQVLADFLNGTLKLTTEGLDGGGGCHHAEPGHKC